MNVVFISPHFPEYYHNFCSRLKDRGVNVLGVGDCPYDMISDNTKNSLTEYYADRPAFNGLTSAGLRSHQREIHGFCSVERDLLLSLHCARAAR